MLLTVFGLYSPQPQHSSPFPSATVRPATTTAVKKTPQTAAAETPPVSAAPAPKKERVAAQPTTTRAPEPKSEVTPDATSSPTAVAQAKTDFASQAESKILELMNTERAKEGLGVLRADAHLATIARAHSADMLTRNFFDHDNPDGCSSSCRANAAGYAWSAIGENIYMTEGYDLSANDEAAMVVDGWMHSAGHRANILGAKYTNGGVGVVVKGEAVYITALYSKPC